jgi:hypothetical protein
MRKKFSIPDIQELINSELDNINSIENRLNKMIKQGLKSSVEYSNLEYELKQSRKLLSSVDKKEVRQAQINRII